MGAQTFLFHTALLSLAVSLSVVNCAEKTCEYVTRNATLGKPTYIQHSSSGKCLRVKSLGLLSDSSIVLDHCGFSSSESLDEQYIFEVSDLGKLRMKINTGRNSNTNCVSTKRGVLSSSTCKKRNFDQNWRLKPTRFSNEKFLIEQYSSKYCLIPASNRKGSGVSLAPCNSYQTEQIWKLCVKKN